ncbi:MAG: sensor histidine kinase [Candidatus Krumholzibacteriia bacterium]
MVTEQPPIPSSSTPGRAVALVRRYWLPALLIALVSFLHYNTAIHIHALHGIYRRLYYFPIVIAAFRGGVRGGLLAAVLVVVMYLPHAFGLIGFDPAATTEKVLEMVLYLALGLLAGKLVERIDAARGRLARTAADLQDALDEKTRMEDELVRTARLAAVGRLSAGLAHEIRNPLASIQGSAEVLADDFPADHPKSDLLRILLQEAGRLNQVLTRFLTFARSEPGERAVFDLGEEVRTVADLLRHRPGNPVVDVRIAGAPCPAFANREQVRQVLLNLGLNAVAASGPSGRTSFSVERRDDRAVCRVCDTGPGFTSEGLENFGTPFYSTRREGTGLGLATSLRLAEDMGGTLTVDRGFAPGACVVLALPAADPEEMIRNGT